MVLQLLKAKFASNKAPDIFGNGGYQEAQTWKDKFEDLSDQPWVKDAYESALLPNDNRRKNLWSAC